MRQRHKAPDPESPEEMRRKFFIGFGVVMVGIILAIVGFRVIVPRVVRLVTGEAVYAGYGTGYWNDALLGKNESLKPGDASNALRGGGEKAVPVLIQLLAEDDAQVRARAARILSQVRSTSAVDALTAAQKDQDRDVRCWAAVALAVSAPESGAASIPNLLEATLISERVAEDVDKALADFPVETRVAGYREALNHHDMYVRFKAVKYLGALGPPAGEAAPQLIDLLIIRQPTDEQGYSLADRAAAALEQVNPDARTQAVERYLADLKNPSADRAAAAYALGRLRAFAKAAVPILLELRKDKDLNLANEAQNALQIIDSKAARSPS